ncbi:dynein light chain Tctex-type protein 2B-like [Halichondria panicea]|uniref:dynein light chain Tctex-type protein 2B-like n=1 Tax=Halichondria panicea TaxID=6063 RepID=UPI00312B6417
MTDPEDGPSTYTIRPKFEKKFRPLLIKDVIHQVLKELLHEKQYSSEEAKTTSKEISDSIQSRLKGLDLDRYKYIVQVVIGEQRGEGVKMGCRCFWDSDTDNYAQDIYMNDTLFCVAAAFGVYHY